MDHHLKIIGRTYSLFADDVAKHENELAQNIKNSRFLVIGGAGTIGQAVVKEIFKRNPKTLHVVDISENNLVELVRDLRSSVGYGDGDFRTLPLDAGSVEFSIFYAAHKPYDYVLNLSALKHVRSEKDPYTLMRLIDVNIMNVDRMLSALDPMDTKKYFAVSSDKAANPANMMGASKRIMELFLMKHSDRLPISMARFANVAFSDGSLLHGFNQRLTKHQPISAPRDVRRYFITPTEAGQLCLMACLFGENKDIFFSKLDQSKDLITFSELAKRYLEDKGYEPYVCSSEDEARNKASELIAKKQWPCYFFDSDTTGEKSFEEFFTATEKPTLDLTSFNDIGVVKSKLEHDSEQLQHFSQEIEAIKSKGDWQKEHLVTLFTDLLPEFSHVEKGKYLDQKM